MVEEAERSLHDALSVLSQTVKETRVTLGGGCAEMLMSCKVDEAARTVSGKKALAVEAFARALRQVRDCTLGTSHFVIDERFARSRQYLPTMVVMTRLIW